MFSAVELFLKEKKVALSNVKKCKWGFIEMVVLTIKEKDISWKKGAIEEREVSPQSHLAPETEGSHELHHSKSSSMASDMLHQRDPPPPLSVIFLLYTPHWHLLRSPGPQGMCMWPGHGLCLPGHWSSLKLSALSLSVSSHHYPFCPLLGIFSLPYSFTY